MHSDQTKKYGISELIIQTLCAVSVCKDKESAYSAYFVILSVN